MDNYFDKCDKTKSSLIPGEWGGYFLLYLHLCECKFIFGLWTERDILALQEINIFQSKQPMNRDNNQQFNRQQWSFVVALNCT